MSCVGLILQKEKFRDYFFGLERFWGGGKELIVIQYLLCDRVSLNILIIIGFYKVKKGG